MDGFESLESVQLEQLDEVERDHHGELPESYSNFPGSYDSTEQTDGMSSLRESKIFLELVDVAGPRLTGKRCSSCVSIIVLERTSIQATKCIGMCPL